MMARDLLLYFMCIAILFQIIVKESLVKNSLYLQRRLISSFWVEFSSVFSLQLLHFEENTKTYLTITRVV